MGRWSRGAIRVSGIVGWVLFVVGVASAGTPSPPTDAFRELALLVRNLDRSERVLYVTAHPDDEDAGLLARLAYRDGAATALLTLTRGEGGQNEIGTELFDALGVLRSRELEAAGIYTGVRQYFSRAFEFGYSFSVEETFDKWGHDPVLRDVVEVVREFRPDVILTMLPDGPGGGQHHQASARLAIEAFDVAASGRWPELGPPHAAARVFRQIWSADEAVSNGCEFDLGEYDPVLGTTYAALGAASRSEHKCQGMARLTKPIARSRSRWEFIRGRGEDEPRPVDQLFRQPASSLGDLAPSSPFVSGIRDEPRNVDAWLGLWTTLHELRTRIRLDPTGLVRLNALTERVSRGLSLSMGLDVAVEIPRRELAAGDDVDMTIEAVRVQGPDASISFSLRAPADADASLADSVVSVTVPPGAIVSHVTTLRIGSAAASTLPHRVPDRDAELPAGHRFLRPDWHAFSLIPILHVSGHEVALAPIRIDTQSVDDAFPRVVFGDPVVVPDPSVRPVRSAVAVPISDAGGRARVAFRVSSMGGGEVVVSGLAPPGWEVSPAELRVETTAGGGEQVVEMEIRALDGATKGVLNAEASYVAEVDSDSMPRPPSTAGVRRIVYPHIRPAGLLEPSAVTVEPFPCEVPTGVRVGLIEGAGDRMDEALGALGVPFTRLTRSELESGRLEALDVIISGVRAYKVREDLKAAHPRLRVWMEAGGVWIVQYNKFEFNAASEEESPYAPYPNTLVGRRRVTVEESPVIVNRPEYSLFHRPNQIGEADWGGWVQERGLYFLDFDDRRYLDLITLEDPWTKNAGPQGGALVVTDVGRGKWVYLGIGLFRQLPAAVPGAYRLLANLLALGVQ